MQEGRGESQKDQHQRVSPFRGGVVIAMLAGVAHWAYNDGDQMIVVITVVDTSNNTNQLDPNHRVIKQHQFIDTALMFFYCT